MIERLKAQKKEGLYFANFEAVSSKDNDFVQIVDLFTGAVNRKLHPQSTLNHKDEFANHIMSITGLDLSGIDIDNALVDNATLFNLR